MSNIEQRIANLENENKARKASYPVAGSLVRFVSQTSQVWTKTGGGNVPITVRVKFTPARPSSGGRSIIELSPRVSINSDFSTTYPRLTFVNEPQSGDGSIIMRTSIATPGNVATYYIRVVATGSSAGTFTLL
jgi:hypothetical protein